MHPNIVKFSNETYYDGKLKTDYKKLKSNNYDAFEIINIDGVEEELGQVTLIKKKPRKLMSYIMN